MPQATILEQFLEVEETGESYRVFIEVVADDERPILEVRAKISNTETDSTLTEFHVGLEVTNPLDPVSIGIAAGTTYGICTTWKLISFTYKTAHEAYKSSKSEKPSCDQRERISDIYNHLTNSSEEYGKTTRSALKNCVGPAAIKGAIGIFF